MQEPGIQHDSALKSDSACEQGEIVKASIGVNISNFVANKRYHQRSAIGTESNTWLKGGSESLHVELEVNVLVMTPLDHRGSIRGP